MVRKIPKTDLPPENHFSLSHILAKTSTGTQDLQRVNDSINTTVNSYTNDISEQLNSLANVEAKLLQNLQRVDDVYNVVHNIRVDSIGNAQVFVDNGNNGIGTTKKKNKGYKLGSMFRIPNNNKETNNRLEQYTKIDNNFNELLNETVVQKKRINNLLERLKNVEMNFSKRERLFDRKSPNKEHYSNLYNYGMNEPSSPKKVNSKLKESTSSSDIIVKPFQPDLKPIIHSNKNIQISNSSIKSQISQQKMNQYLTIENELEEIQKVISNKSVHSSANESSFNPVSLLTKDSPTCKLNDESVTIRLNDKDTAINCSENPQVGLLLDGLKKLYN
ncbi:hypothetical protein C6P40_003232 [Pichia californica]|uniref:Uncharacterized protein n=1 Tax=Pichia californica TaxID=460514 RepID=A0A9P6WQV3_9ASCO|nr:hypothetical protein C6P42_004292 [[Candida] californica]KAG0690308.1 hypothetical protein C6P40_003232 [[Candida] californica]